MAATLSLSPSPMTGREEKRSGRDRLRTSENQASKKLAKFRTGFGAGEGKRRKEFVELGIITRKVAV